MPLFRNINVVAPAYSTLRSISISWLLKSTQEFYACQPELAKCPTVVSVGSVSSAETALNPSVELVWHNVDAASTGCMLITSVDENISKLQVVEEYVCIYKSSSKHYTAAPRIVVLLAIQLSEVFCFLGRTHLMLSSTLFKIVS